jgi:glycosyltransferase involved in cell wall biosynthesis
MTPSVSIIVPCKNEVNYIDNLVKSILNQDYPKQNLEVLLIDGASNDGTDKLINHYTVEYPFIKYISNPEQTVPYAMNKGIRTSKGDIIVRLDAHAEYPINYISTLVSHLQSLNADNVGGVCKTTPANNSSLAKAIAAVISHPFGVGNSHHRVGYTYSCRYRSGNF